MHSRLYFSHSLLAFPMAYNFENGSFHSTIMGLAEKSREQHLPRARFAEVKDIYPDAICYADACSELLEFYMSFPGSPKVEDPTTLALFGEYCKTFHMDEEAGLQEEAYERFLYVVNYTKLNIHPAVKERFVRLLSAIHANKRGILRVNELLHEQQCRAEARRAAEEVERERLAKQMEALDLLAAKQALYKDSSYSEIKHMVYLRVGGNAPMTNSLHLRYFAMNIRCSAMNYLRERFPEIRDHAQRQQLLTAVEACTSVYNLVKLLGFSAVLFRNLREERCIFRSTYCCVLSPGDKEMEFFSGTSQTRSLAVDVALSDFSGYVYRACMEHVRKSGRGRMEYTRRFSKK